MLKHIITLLSFCTVASAAQIKVAENNSALAKGVFSLQYKITWLDKNGDRVISENNVGPAPVTLPKHKDYSELNAVLAGLNDTLEHKTILRGDVKFSLNCKDNTIQDYYFTTAMLKKNQDLILGCHAPIAYSWR